MEYKYKISVVVPVYNTELYVGETIESVINQTIGFNDNIQLILINDGSKDASSIICESYKNKYPDNILFIDKENEGVSTTRNLGIELAEGEYICFLDSDDKWDLNAFEFAIELLDKYKESDVLVGKINYFGKLDSDHSLNYKFETGKILRDLDDEYTCIQTTIGNCFFRTEIAKDFRFNTDIRMSEDTLFVNEILLQKKKILIANNIHYFYRIRENTSSLTSDKSLDIIFQDFEVCKRLISSSLKYSDKVEKFIQLTLIYILRWKILSPIESEISSEDKLKLKEDIGYIIKYVDDEVISTTGINWLSYKNKVALYTLKHKDYKEQMQLNSNGDLTYNGNIILSLNNYYIFYITSLNIVDGKLYVEGLSYLDSVSKDFKLYCKDAEKEYSSTLTEFPIENTNWLTGETLLKCYKFNFEIPINNNSNISFYVKFPSVSNEEFKLNPGFKKFALLERSIKCSYSVIKPYILFYRDKSIHITEYKFLRHLKFEAKRIREILKNSKYDKTDRINYSLFRIKFFIYSLTHKKTTWLFMDKEWSAGDNGENLYRYAVKHNSKDKLYFAINKKTEYYKNVKKYGHPIEPFNDKYKLIFLNSTYMISSRTEAAIRNPFGKNINLVKDLNHQHFIYLSHGTLFGDLSSMLNKIETNFSLYAVSSNCEYENLLSKNYGFKNDEVKILGMARYDAYETNDVKKVIAFLPTWRSNIAAHVIPGTTEREYNTSFKTTEYFNFYQGLISDKRLLDAMQKFGYKGEFYVHPAFEKQAKDFTGNDIISIGSSSANYEEILKKSSMMITDYSGVAFDFGYQRKPIVYSQFDSIFTHDHTYGEESYFDFENEGFGPVAHTIDETIDRIIEYLENDCKQSDIYKKHADAFFPYDDYKNCERIYNEILKIKI